MAGRPCGAGRGVAAKARGCTARRPGGGMSRGATYHTQSDARMPGIHAIGTRLAAPYGRWPVTKLPATSMAPAPAGKSTVMARVYGDADSAKSTAIPSTQTV